MNKIVLALGAVGLLAGCSSSPVNENDVGVMERPPEVIDRPPEQSFVDIGTNKSVPNWFLVLPVDSEDRIYAVGTGLSDDMQFAFDKALHEAKVNLADKLSAKSSAELKSYISDNGRGSTSGTTRKHVKVSKSGFKNIDVSKYRIEQRAVLEDRRYFRTYVQVSIDPNNRYVDEPLNTFDPVDDQTAQEAMDNL